MRGLEKDSVVFHVFSWGTGMSETLVQREAVSRGYNRDRKISSESSQCGGRSSDPSQTTPGNGGEAF